MKVKHGFWKSALIGLCAAFVGISAGCSGTTGGTASSEVGSTSSETAQTYAPFSNDEVVNLEGYEFTIGSPFIKNDVTGMNLTAQELIFEQARRKTEELLNCKINIINMVADMPTLQSRIMSGDKVADLLDISPYSLYSAINAGYIRPMEEIEGIDYNDPRWVAGYTTLATYKGRHYGLNFIRPPEARYVLFFNKDLIRSSGVTEDLYQLVRDGEWTFDKFREICIATTKDTDSNGEPDTYGLHVSDPVAAGLALINANNGKMVDVVDGQAVEAFTSSQVITGLNFYNQLVNEDKTVHVYDYMRSEDTLNDAVSIQDLANYFLRGKAAFWLCESWVGNQYIRPSSAGIEYGMLPLPKGPDASDYVSPAYNARVFSFTTTNKDLDKAVLVFNTLAKFVYGDDETWWHEDVANDYFQADDTDSLEMYLLCLEKSSLDLGYVTGVDQVFGTNAIAKGIYLRQSTPAAQAEALKGTLTETINGILN